MLFLFLLKRKNNILLKRIANNKPAIVPTRGSVFKYQDMYSKSVNMFLFEINIELPKKVEPIPIKISLKYKPEKILPIVSTDKANKIPLPISEIFCIKTLGLLFLTKKVKYKQRVP